MIFGWSPGIFVVGAYACVCELVLMPASRTSLPRGRPDDGIPFWLVSNRMVMFFFSFSFLSFIFFGILWTMSSLAHSGHKCVPSSSISRDVKSNENDTGREREKYRERERYYEEQRSCVCAAQLGHRALMSPRIVQTEQTNLVAQRNKRSIKPYHSIFFKR